MPEQHGESIRTSNQTQLDVQLPRTGGIIMSNLIGPKGQLYADPKPTPGEVSFKVDNTSSNYYNSVYYTQHKNDVQRIPPARGTDPLNLADFVSTDIVGAIN